MDEARRFLRYVAPGVLYGILTVTFLFAMMPEWTVNTLAQLPAETSVGEAVIALLASGGIGYLLASLHHHLHWASSNEASDHSEWLQAVVGKTVELRDPASDKVLKAPVDPENAWAVLTSLWYQRGESSTQIRAATERTINLADLVHTLGTSRMAVIIAYFTACGTALYVVQVTVSPAQIASLVVGAVTTVLLWIGRPRTMSKTMRFGIAAVGTVILGTAFWLILDAAKVASSSIGMSTGTVLMSLLLAGSLLWIFQSSYLRTGRFARIVIESVLSDALHAESTWQRLPVIAYVSQRRARPML